MNSTRLIPIRTKVSSVLVEIDNNETGAVEGTAAATVTGL
jgi:hypothetical protein